MAKAKPKSRDGVPIEVGTLVVHFMDEWKHRGKVLLIDTDEHGRTDIVYREGKYNSRATYSPDILYATEAGLLRGKLEDARESLLRHRDGLMKAEAEIERLTREVESAESR